MIESPMRTVNALTVLSLPVLSFAKKNSPENRLPTIAVRVKTMMIFTNMTLSNPVS